MIYYIIGIRRSGLHAIANWLFPMMGEYIYLNNYELGKLQENELVVNGNFNVIIGLENKPVDEVFKYTNNGKRIWVWRNPDEVWKSQEKWYGDRMPFDMATLKLKHTISLLPEYRKILDSNEFVVIYENWLNDIEYRECVAIALHLEFNDSNKEKIFGYGKSSFAE